MGKEYCVYKHNNETYQQKLNKLYNNQFTLLITKILFNVKC